MRWEDERYVRVYTRDTVPWIALDWEAQALFLFILRKVDRAGILELGKAGVRGLAGMVRMPVPVVEAALPLLLEDGCLEQRGTAFIIRNYIEAQEASMSPNMRQTESRLRRRDMVRSGLDPNQRETVLYFIQSEHGGPVKIGIADDVAKRIVNLQTARPDKLVLLGAVPATVADERAAHKALATWRDKGEWFTHSPEVAAFMAATVTRGAIALDAVTCHETRHVTPSDPIRAVPSQPPEQRDPGSAGHEPDGSGPSIGSERQAPAAEQPAPEAPTPGPQFSLTIPEAKPPTPTEQVFAAWLEGWRRKHPRASRAPSLDDKRRRVIAARLRDFDPSVLAAAARGIWLSAFHLEGNHTELTLALRDAEHVEKFAAIAANPALGRDRPSNGGRVEPNIQTAGNWRPPPLPPIIFDDEPGRTA